MKNKMIFENGMSHTFSKAEFEMLKWAVFELYRSTFVDPDVVPVPETPDPSELRNSAGYKDFSAEAKATIELYSLFYEYIGLSCED